MSVERFLKRLRRYRLENERFDRLVRAVMSNETVARGVRKTVSAVATRQAGPAPPLAAPPTVFFIVGQARSGTTWLRTTLGQHPEILCRGEGRFFEQDFLREDYEDWEVANIVPVSLYGAIAGSGRLRAWVERSVWAQGRGTEEHLRNLTRLAVDYFLMEQLAGTGKRIVGDKTPFVHAQFVEEISRIYPEAKVIHIIRDGRDVAVSKVHHLWANARSEGGIYDLAPDELRRRGAFREGTSGSESLFAPGRLAEIAADWSGGVGRVVEDGPALLGDNYVEVRYEDLLAEPEVRVRHLLRFLGADASDGAVARCVEGGSFERGANRKPGEEDSSSRHRKGIAGDWRNVFTAEDREVFKRAGGGLLIQLGYERDDAW